MRVRIVFEVDVSRRSDGDKLARDLMSSIYSTEKPKLVYAATEICDESTSWRGCSWVDSFERKSALELK